MTTPDQSNGFQIVGSPESREIAAGVWAREISFREPIAHVQWSPDGRWLAVLTAHRELILLDQGLARKRANYEPLGQIEAFCFDPSHLDSLLVLLWNARRDQLRLARISLQSESLLDVQDFEYDQVLDEMQGFLGPTINLLMPLIPRIVKQGVRIAMADGLERLACLAGEPARKPQLVELGSAKVAEMVFSPWNPEALLASTMNGLQVWNCTTAMSIHEDQSVGPYPLLAMGRGAASTPVVIGTRLSQELCLLAEHYDHSARIQTNLDWLTGLQICNNGELLVAIGTRKTDSVSTSVCQLLNLRASESDMVEVDLDSIAPSPELMNRGGMISNPGARQVAILQNDFWQSGRGPTLWLLDFPNVTTSSGSNSAIGNKVVVTRRYTSAKIVLLGDSGAGKSTLGGQLAEKKFRPFESTHGQQFWRVDDLAPPDPQQPDVECETVLWDLAGQADYRLIHALHIEDADLAIIVFNPGDHRDSLGTVEYWLQQLPPRCRKILVANKIDRGWGGLTPADLDQWCAARQVEGSWLTTTATTGTGVAELRQRITEQLSSSQRPHIVEGTAYYQIRQAVLAMKELPEFARLIPLETLVDRLRVGPTPGDWTLEEVRRTCLHLGRNGFVRLLTTSQGEERLLLDPTLVNNLAASFILEARRNPRGLGALEEDQLLAGGYRFPELEELPPEDRQYLIEAVVELFLQRRLSYRCFREMLGTTRLLVFPELMNLRKPSTGVEEVDETVSYTVEGATENLYASLVVRLGYTNVFESAQQWQNEARYLHQRTSVCGFRQQVGEGGVREFYLLFGRQVPPHTRQMFQGLFESFLDPGQLPQEQARSVQVHRWPRVECPACRTGLDWIVQRKFQKQGFTFCNQCGQRLNIPQAAEPIGFTPGMERRIEVEKITSRLRTEFEQALYRLKSLVAQQSAPAPPPELFVSYAWGVSQEERWVEQFVEDLEKAGFEPWFDRHHNAAPGKSIARFVERVSETPRILVIGTPGYLRKHVSQGNVVSAEMDLINQRFIGTREADRETIIPLLLSGSEVASFPPFLRKRVYVDFRQQPHYFERALDLFLQLHGVPATHPAFRDWRKLFQTEARQALPEEAPGSDEGRSAETPAALREALHRVGRAAAEAAALAGHPLPVWNQGQVVLEPAEPSRLKRGAS